MMHGTTNINNMQCYVLICRIYATVAEWHRINSVRLGDKSAWHRVHPMSHRLWMVRIWPTFSRSYHPLLQPLPTIRYRFDKCRLLSPACHSFFFFSLLMFIVNYFKLKSTWIDPTDRIWCLCFFVVLLLSTDIRYIIWTRHIGFA